MRIGLIGLGNMGAPIAAHLVRAEHNLLVWNRGRRWIASRRVTPPLAPLPSSPVAIQPPT
jgi:3-hydroxyisobutyrate dehydrogenase-like beta-hydroxyacid dehydrogenase